MYDNAKTASGRRFNYVDMTGERIGHLVVVREAFNVNGKPRWLCDCDCGEQFIIEGFHLRSAQRRGSKEYSCPVCRPERQRKLRAQRRKKAT
jgi:hypothetical protein